MRSYTKAGEEALIEAGRLWAVHDGIITTVSAENVGGCVVVRMTCASRPDSPAKEVRLKFSDVCQLSLEWDSGFEFFSVDEYKSLRLESGLYYFSIDPYDERSPVPDSRDGGVVISKEIEAEFVLKE
jgi:hypothetical protein